MEFFFLMIITKKMHGRKKTDFASYLHYGYFSQFVPKSTKKQINFYIN